MQERDKSKRNPVSIEDDRIIDTLYGIQFYPAFSVQLCSPAQTCRHAGSIIDFRERSVLLSS
jgi:hypothetical protein